jgi:hypothetical protein
MWRLSMSQAAHDFPGIKVNVCVHKLSCTSKIKEVYCLFLVISKVDWLKIIFLLIFRLFDVSEFCNLIDCSFLCANRLVDNFKMI